MPSTATDCLAAGSWRGLAWAIGAALATAATGAPSIAAAPSLVDVDYPTLVSRADLIYGEPCRRSEEGQPVGNGRMGSLVWTTPTQLKLQINHVNVYGINCETDSFPVRHADYASGCGYVDITFVDYGDEVFAGNAFKQRLSLYDGVMTAEGAGISARVLGWRGGDVLAIEIDDQRERPTPISVDLRMLRYMMQYHEGRNYELAANHEVMVRTASHTASSRLDIRDGKTLLVQEFREEDFYGASALAAAIVGRPSQARFQNDAMVRLTAAPGRGKFTVLLAAAASLDDGEDVSDLAMVELERAAAKGFDQLQSETAQWWQAFWQRGFVHLHSADGQADFLEQQYTYFLYLMASSSLGGDYPPRFGGMIWYTTGDMRAWGSQHWWANTSAYYSNLMPCGRLELMDPMFAMYSGMYDSCARAARQQWGSQGIWIPETVWFDGLDNLPTTIADEMRELYLARKPWEQASVAFHEWASTKQPHYSRVNWKDHGRWENGRWVARDKGTGPFGHTTHILGAGARIAELYWQRYQYTMDEAWLRDRAYPMLRGAAEFYRHFPNFKKGDDGRYHLYHVNNSESDWNTADTPYEVEGLHMIFPTAVRASAILGVDEELRVAWQEIAERLPPKPERSRRGRRGFGAFVYGGPGAIEPLGGERELKSRFLSFTQLGSFIDERGIGGAQIFRNRLRLREGPGAIDAEHVAGLSGGIHSSLLDSTPAEPGADPVLRLFSTWPKDWNASFTLLARGGFLVSSVQHGGETPWVQIESKAGSRCRIQNPWSGRQVTLWRDGAAADGMAGEMLEFPTEKAQIVVLAPQGTTPSAVRLLD